jgi:hypothetical protein
MRTKSPRTTERGKYFRTALGTEDENAAGSLERHLGGTRSLAVSSKHRGPNNCRRGHGTPHANGAVILCFADPAIAET